MSEIKVGDLVVQVRATHECLTRHIGIPFIVDTVHPTTGCCGFCGARVMDDDAIGAAGGSVPTIPVAWLKKIDPPAQDETTEHREELHA